MSAHEFSLTSESARVESDTSGAAGVEAVRSEPVLVLLAVWFFALIAASVAAPAAADMSSEARMALNQFGSMINPFLKTEPCGPEGIIPNISGRCLSVPNAGDCAPILPDTDGPNGLRVAVKAAAAACTESLDLSLGLEILIRDTSGNGSELLSVVPMAHELFFVPIVETSCGTWSAEMVVDPPDLQIPSEIVLHRDSPNAEEGSMHGHLGIGIRTRFIRGDGAIVEIPSLMDLELTGSWRVVPSQEGPSIGRFELQPLASEDTCWRWQSIAGQPQLVDHCVENTCPADGSFCSPWCAAGAEI